MTPTDPAAPRPQFNDGLIRPAAAGVPAPKPAAPRPATGAGNPFGAILNVSAALVSSLDLDDVFDTVAERIAEAMMVWGVEIQSYDPITRTLKHESCWCIDGTSAEDRSRVGETVEVIDRPSLIRLLADKKVVERRIDDPDLPADERAYLESRGFRCALYAPLVVGGVALGLLTAIERRFVRRFTPIESDLFRQLCDIAAAAINNAQLYRSLDQQKRQTHLLENTQVMTSSLDIDAVLAAILRIVSETFGIDSVDIYELAAGDNLVCIASCNPHDPEAAAAWVGEVLSLADHPGYRRVFELKTVVEYHADEELRRTDPDLYSEMIEWSEMSVTEIGLFNGDEVVGCLSLCSRTGVQRLDDEQKDYLVGLAAAAAIGIRNARMYRHRTVLVEASRSITTTTGLEEVLASITREATLALRSSQAAIYYYDPEFDVIHYKALYEHVKLLYPDDDLETVYDLNEYPRDRALLLSRELMVEQLSDPDLPEDRRKTMALYSEHTTLNVPLWYGDQPLGILRLYEMEHPRAFTESDLALAAGLGEQAALALHSAEGYAAAERRQGYVNVLLEIARALSTSPDTATACAAISRDCAAVFEAQRAIIFQFEEATDSLIAQACYQAVETPGYDTTGEAEPVDDTPGNRTLLQSSDPVVEQLSDPNVHPVTLGEMEHWGEKTVLNIPLRFRDRPVGIIMLIWTEAERRLRREELDFAMGIGEQVALALYQAEVRA